VEELKTTPNDIQPTSAPALAAQALDQELNSGILSSKIPQAAINDLTSMVVKKKKKPATDDGTGKRKAVDEQGASTPPDKKARLEP
jgi:HAT1-interacting factor 1